MVHSMNIHIRFFAGLREQLKSSGFTIQLPPDSSVVDAITQIKEICPEFAFYESQCQTAVNQKFVNNNTTLCDNDEIAFIPPVSGGSNQQIRIASIIDRAPNVNHLIEAVQAPHRGALVTFIGVVRNHNEGHCVERMEYEAYPEMANSMLISLCEDIEQSFEHTRLAVQHRIGAVSIGDPVVAIASGAPHRKEAFLACQQLIERLKKTLPIWKKEFSNNNEEWLGFTP